MSKDKNILVVYGGPSSEAEVSARTATAVLNSLNKLGYKAEKQEFSKDLASKLNELKPDIVFNAMHGAYGEDGALQGLLECLKIPYTHSGVRASAIAMDKVMTKDILLNYGVTFAHGEVISKKDILAGKYKKPCVIKPIDDGSSVGVIILKENDQLKEEQLMKAEKFLVEEFVDGREITVAVLNGKALGSVEIRPNSGVYDYKSKYTKGATEYLVPAQVPYDVLNQAHEFAEIAHNILNCRGVSRSDMIYSEKNKKLYFLEINTHPGMTETSLVPKVAAQLGMSFEDLVEKILETAGLEIMAK